MLESNSKNSNVILVWEGEWSRIEGNISNFDMRGNADESRHWIMYALFSNTIYDLVGSRRRILSFAAGAYVFRNETLCANQFSWSQIALKISLYEWKTIIFKNATKRVSINSNYFFFISLFSCQWLHLIFILLHKNCFESVKYASREVCVCVTGTDDYHRDGISAYFGAETTIYIVHGVRCACI